MPNNKIPWYPAISLLYVNSGCSFDLYSNYQYNYFPIHLEKKKDKIKRQVMYQNYNKGGIRVPNADVMAKSLRLAWISRLLSNDEEWSQVWKAIPNHFFDMYGDLNFLLRCN